MSRNILILLQQAGRLDEFIDDFFTKKELHGLNIVLLLPFCFFVLKVIDKSEKARIIFSVSFIERLI